MGGGTSDFTVIHMAPSESLQVLSMGGVSIAGDVMDGSIMSEEISPYFGSKVTYQMPLSSNILKMPANLKYRLASPADITLMSRSDIMDFLNQVKRSTVTSSDSEKMENLFQLIGDNLGFSVFEEIERGKRSLGQLAEYCFDFTDQDFFIQHKVTRTRFHKIIEPKIDEIFQCLSKVLKDSGVKASSVSPRVKLVSSFE